MKQGVGTAIVIQFVLIFVLIFSAYLALSVKFSKTFNMKNEVINIIEKYDGPTNDAVSIINNYLESSGYQASGKCPDITWKGVKSFDSNEAGSISVNDKYIYCVKKVNGYNKVHTSTSYFKVKLFFKFGLPVLDDIATFDVDGETVDIMDPKF